jgi:hypothetical protein
MEGSAKRVWYVTALLVHRGVSAQKEFGAEVQSLSQR